MARVARTELPSSPALKGEKWGRGKEAGGDERRGGGEGGGGERRHKRRGGGLGLGVGAVLVWRPGAGRQVVEGRRGLVLIAVAARGHPLVDEVQTSSLLEALDLVLWVEALNGCNSKQNDQNHQNTAANGKQSSSSRPIVPVTVHKVALKATFKQRKTKR